MRSLLPTAFSVFITLTVPVVAAADTLQIDPMRLAAARANAERWWTQSGLDRLPTHYDPARIESAIRGDEPWNIVTSIAVATLNSNPNRKDAVIQYLNEALLPFALSHKAQYVCLVTELFYNLKTSIEELNDLAVSGSDSDATGMALVDYAYFLIKTKPERAQLGLNIPAGDDIPAAVDLFGKTLRPNDGALVAAEAAKLNCANTPAA